MGLQASDIQHFLQEGATLPASSVLADAVETYPYAPLLHFLYLRSLQEEDSYKFPAQLHRTAVSTMHRQALLDWAEAPLIPVEVQAAAWQKKQPAESTPTMDQPPSAVPNLPDLSSEGEVPSLESVGVAPEVPAIPEAPAVPTSTPDRPSESTTPSPSVPVPASSAPSSKPATTTKLADINLDALPPAVRVQVLRSRAIQAQWGKVSAQEWAPEPKEFPAPEPPVSIPVAPEPAPTPEAATPPAQRGLCPLRW